MKNKFSPIFIITAMLATAFFTACESVPGSVPAPTPQVDIVDRHDIALGEDRQKPSIQNAVVDGFIAEYNEKQTDPNLRVAPGYRVEYDDFAQAYHVISDTINLIVREKDGKFLFAGLSADSNLDISDEITVSLTILDIVKAHNGNVPGEVVQYMNNVKSRAEEIMGEYATAVGRINDALKNIDKEEYLHGLETNSDGGMFDDFELPQSTLPPVESIPEPGNDPSIPDVP